MIKKIVLIAALAMPISAKGATPPDFPKSYELYEQLGLFLEATLEQFPAVANGTSLNNYTQTAWGNWIDKICPSSGYSEFSREFRAMCRYLFWENGSAASIRYYLDQIGEYRGRLTDKYVFFYAFAPCDGAVNTEYVSSSGVKYWNCAECEAGTYAADTSDKCIPCPDGGTTAEGATKIILQCYIPSGTQFDDDTGSGVYSDNCYYSE